MLIRNGAINVFYFLVLKKRIDGGLLVLLCHIQAIIRNAKSTTWTVNSCGVSLASLSLFLSLCDGLQKKGVKKLKKMKANGLYPQQPLGVAAVTPCERESESERDGRHVDGDCILETSECNIEEEIKEGGRGSDKERWKQSDWSDERWNKEVED